MSLVAAALLGIAQMYLLTILWGYISAYTWLPRWLLTLGLKGTALHAVVFLSDSLLNVIFCLPAAYAICRQAARLFDTCDRSGLHLAISSVFYRHVLT